MDYGILSVLPPLFAIVLAIISRQVFISLFLGVWLGAVIRMDGHLLAGTIQTIQDLVNVFKEDGNTRTIMFSALVGVLIAFIQKSGGVKGFIRYINEKQKLLDADDPKSRIKVQFLAFLVGVVVFVESSITVLTVGSIFRPLFDRMRISREKLAYIADSTSAPVCILIPLNAWGAYIMGVLITLGVAQPLHLLVQAYPYNFYPIITLLFVLFIIFKQKDFGPMKRAEQRTVSTGALHDAKAQPLISDDLVMLKPDEQLPGNMWNMIVPIAVMVLMMPVSLLYTGWNPDLFTADMAAGTMIITALGNGSGSTSVLWAVLTAMLVAAVMYHTQKLFKTKQLIDLAFKGIGSLMPLAVLMMLAFAIGKMSKDLGTGIYLAEVSKSFLHPGMVPFILFITASFIAFSTGTSWGTFAIMLAIAVPMAEQFDHTLPLAVAAVLSGGIFGDHCSPISDTTIISSMASACDHIDHVKTQLPYALVAGGLSSVLFLAAGFLA